MKESANMMKRGAVAVLFSCMLCAASFPVAAADDLAVTAQLVSLTKVAIEVRNDTDRDISGVVDVRVVVAGMPMSVPVNVDLAPGATGNVTVDLSRLLLPNGPLTVITDEGTPF